ncbi:cytochrome p450 protein [Diplodia corticola]|uniref:Cytochrome p450 protein n=1 Tax=Diplodia corticola TaxID=236234 RepID=A0A1J9QLS3_9PEZI|nr:cytochrome p450 protein [Diplodia corticola]OJD29408.1 cytochrome p450 protein [Diplodia corticola]
MSDSPAINPSHPYHVHTGIWTNWSFGSVYGATLTLRREDANLLVAFMAVFVSIIGNRLWRICCFAFHQAYASNNACDGLHHQRQAVLRNSSTAASGLVTLIELPWAWRNTAREPFGRILPLLIFAALFTTAFILASGFSSKIVTGTEVLLSGNDCTWFDPNLNGTLDSLGALIAFQFERTQVAASYAHQCYSSDSSNILGCNVFIKKMLPATLVKNASCPFEDKICRNANTNIFLDTGFLDSHTDFGLNAPPSQRFQYRRVLHCAPLITEGYKTIWNASSDRSYTTYNYGSSSSSYFNYTYPNEAVWNSSLQHAGTYPVDYAIGTQEVSYTNGSVHYLDSELVPALRRPDADVSIIYLSAGGILFTQKTTDDWYRATTETTGPFEEPYNVPFYAQDEPASPLACAKQEQLCNPNLPDGSRCSPLSGNLDMNANLGKLAGGNKSANLISWLHKITLQPDISLTQVVSILGSQALRSKQTVGYGVQSPLPDGQWQLDVQHWFAISLAMIQERFVDAAAGHTDSAIRPFVKEPDNREERMMCSSQKIMSSEHTSFSLFALLFILVVGVLVVIASFVLEPVALWVRKRYGLDYGAHLEWYSNETLQLQRLAHEGVGVGTWSHAVNDIPLTGSGELLATLDLTDKEHPTLQRPVRPFLQIKRNTSTEGREANGTDFVDESVFEYNNSRSSEHLIENPFAQNRLGNSEIGDEGDVVRGGGVGFVGGGEVVGSLGEDVLGPTAWKLGGGGGAAGVGVVALGRDGGEGEVGVFAEAELAAGSG